MGNNLQLLKSNKNKLNFKEPLFNLSIQKINEYFNIY